MIVNATAWLKNYTLTALRHYTQHPGEFFTSLSLMLLGIWLIIYPNLPAYAYLTKITPWQIWGEFFFIVGFVSRFGLLTQKYRVRHIGILAVLFCRLFLLISAGLSTHWISPTIPEHFAWCIISIWAYFRLER